MPASCRLPKQMSFRAMLAERFTDLAEELGECCALEWHPKHGFTYVEASAGDDGGDCIERTRKREAEVYGAMARMAEEVDAMRRAESREVAAVPAQVEG